MMAGVLTLLKKHGGKLLGGAGTAIAAVVAILNYRAKRRVARTQTELQLVVTVSFGRHMYIHSISDEDHMFLEGTNSGARRVTLTGAGLSLSDGNRLAWLKPEGERRLPCGLAEGQRCLLWMPMRLVKGSLQRDGFNSQVKVVGFFRDTLGTEYRSKPAVVDLESS
jgi:hypothetical protein